MNMDRLRQLLKTYGASPDRWPDEDRDAARKLLAENPDARRWLSAEASLDEMLNTFEVDVPVELKHRILARIPETSNDMLDRLIDWIIPSRDHLWRPVVVAIIPLVAGIVIGGTVRIGDTADDADIWQEEIYVMALNADDAGVAQ